MTRYFACFFLVVFSFGKGLWAQSLQCPSYDGFTKDTHLVFQFESDWTYRSISAAVAKSLSQSEVPEVQKIEASVSRDLDRNSLLIFSFHTGSYHSLYPYPVEDVERAILSNLNECFSTQRLKIPPDRTSLVFSESFDSHQGLTVALVQVLYELSEDVEVLSEDGRRWLCSIAPEHEACPLSPTQ